MKFKFSFVGVPLSWYVDIFWPLIKILFLLISFLLNVVIIKDVSLFAIYAVVIGIFNVKYSK